MIQEKILLPPTHNKANWNDYQREVGTAQAQLNFESSQCVQKSTQNNTANHPYLQTSDNVFIRSPPTIII